MIAIFYYIYYQVMSEHEPSSLFGGYFNLHPSDAYQQVLHCSSFLSAFTQAFKERIETEIEYSRSLLRVSGLLSRFVTPAEPSPVSFIASAFQVEHEQRARLTLQLAEYLHSEVEAPCVRQTQVAEEELRRLDLQLKGFYKQGESVEEGYQKNLKRFYKAHQEWEERLIAKTVLTCTPGATPTQKEKAASRLQEDRREREEYRPRYIQGLNWFNNFANRYNNAIGGIVQSLERVQVGGLTLQTDSIRKLIVSEISMFKNIEYDLLNISRQMESIVPGKQIERFVSLSKDVFASPIISIYREGPVANRYHAIDLKVPIYGTFFEESLVKIDNRTLYYLLDNKNNSTLKYAVKQLMLRQEGTECVKEDSGDFLRELQTTIASNKSVKMMALDTKQGESKSQQKLKAEQVQSSCIQLTNAIGLVLRDQKQRRDSLFQIIEGHLSCHHFYRFIAYAALNAHQQKHEQRVTGENFPLLVKIIVQRSLAARDVFVGKLALGLLFAVAYLTDRPRFCYQFQPIRSLECWQSRDFWLAAIIQSCVQVSTLLPAIERSYLRDVYLMRQKNVVFSALATYCHYMVLLGGEVKEVKLIMTRFADMYNLTEEHQVDLGKSIAASLQQLKQMD